VAAWSEEKIEEAWYEAEMRHGQPHAGLHVLRFCGTRSLNLTAHTENGAR